MGTTRTVLVVDDEEPVRLVVARWLSAHGHEVVAAGSRSEALEQSGPFDVGVFDIGLGEDCGIELAIDMLRQGRVGKAVFHTGGADLAQIARALGVGVVVQKGDGLETLFRAVE